MYWLAVAFGIALVATLLTGGRVAGFLRLQIQSLWMLVLGLGGQIALWLIEVPAGRIDDLGFALLMLSYALLLAFCFVNIRVRGMAILTVGVAMNATVVGLNEGMPTGDREIETRAGRVVEGPVQRTVTERPESDDDLLPFLGQVIRLPDNPIDDALSPGDLVTAAGIAVVFAAGGRRPRRRAAAAVDQPVEEERARATVVADAPPPPPTPRPPPSPVPRPSPSPDPSRPEPAPSRPLTAAEEWAAWRAELHQVAGDRDGELDEDAGGAS